MKHTTLSSAHLTTAPAQAGPPPYSGRRGERASAPQPLFQHLFALLAPAQPRVGPSFFPTPRNT